MELLLGCGCLLGVGGLLALPLVMIANKRIAQQEQILEAVDIESLTPAQLVKWQAHKGKLALAHKSFAVLNDAELREVQSWPTR